MSIEAVPYKMPILGGMDRTLEHVSKEINELLQRGKYVGHILLHEQVESGRSPEGIIFFIETSESRLSSQEVEALRQVESRFTAGSPTE